VVWIKGECASGEKNDLLMQNLVGPNWKEITGAFQPVIRRDASPGFDFDKFWEGLLLEEKQWWKLYPQYASEMGLKSPIDPDEQKSVELPDLPEQPTAEKPTSEEPTLEALAPCSAPLSDSSTSVIAEASQLSRDW